MSESILQKVVYRGQVLTRFNGRRIFEYFLRCPYQIPGFYSLIMNFTL